MEMEVNSKESVSPTDKKRSTGRTSKSPRKVRPASGKTRDPEQPDKSGKHEERGMRTSVLQGKVKALKEKQIKEKESRLSGSPRSEGDICEDALVSPQLRTYLTEDLLDCNKQEMYSGAQPEFWGSDELWGTCNIGGSSVSPCNSCQIENLSNPNHIENSSPLCPHECLHSSCDNPSGTPCTTGDPLLLSLAERVERNRQELRCKFNRKAGHNVETSQGGLPSQGHSSKDVSWLFPGDIDADSGVSIPIADDCRELSVRHEQAKQLLHRARMKAKGASPLRASHCVLPHPHSQPSLRRGLNVTGGVTDGGSQSDSSSSDYCSWHKGSRGSSPSHVRFQDESERDVEERYRERQHIPQTSSVTSTPPPKRQANGSPSWTEQLSPSGHGQCGACGSNIRGSGGSPAATHGTNLRNVHLGSKITQDGSLSTPLGVKPSPHWILPSQPWRVHTELIRETHIGGDSTADSSGEEDGSRTQSSTSHRWGAHKLYKNSSPNTPEHGAMLRPTRSFSDTQTRSNPEQIIKGKNGTSVFAVESRFKEKSVILEPNSVLKISESNPQVAAMTSGYYVDSVRPGLAKMPQDIEGKPTRKSRSLTLDMEKGFNTLHAEIETGNIVLNLDSRQGTTDQKEDRAHSAPKVPSIPIMVSQSDSGKIQGNLSNRVPIPPLGKAPTIVLSRNGRLRTESVNQQLVQGGNKVPVFQDKKGNHSNLVPNSKVTNPDLLGDIDNHHLPTSDMKGMESKVREVSSNSKKQSEEKKSKEAKENRTFGRKQVKREPRDNESSHTGTRHIHGERNNSPKDLRESRPNPKVGSHSREETLNEGNFLTNERCTEKPRSNGQQQTASNERTGSGPVIATKDRCMEPAHESKVQSEVKKGDLRSGMRKIFSSIGLTSRPKLERFQSSSLEQITPPDLHKGHPSANGDRESYVGCEKLGRMKKSPSLQSLKLMSPFNLPKRASSVQNLLGKSDRSAAYITDVSAAPRRALSVEDIGSPGMARALGKVAEVYPDGTRLLELHCLEKGGFGFSVSSGNGRPDSGIYVQDMSDANTAKLYSGLLRVGDEILEVNGAKVSTLGLGQLNDILYRESVLSLRVLHQRRTKC
ncbi:hypothetical protein GDO78_009177 [Eleutherodactylus coqui]|uniref:PDZ domain-containing protein n=2 Tax=Eleutherodactylus coqui TaxID=57060 RepID=A0A8J6F7R2_ELECQ|nr:hypothetical protein GDO78_009177 [Eleutherodactylus coqui]KAG9483092.1 hypothetical protein GDO78_009177 [Eleutherodactylus coqui]